MFFNIDNFNQTVCGKHRQNKSADIPLKQTTDDDDAVVNHRAGFQHINQLQAVFSLADVSVGVGWRS